MKRSHYEDLWALAKEVDSEIAGLYDEAEERGSLVWGDSDSELMERLKMLAQVSHTVLVYLKLKKDGE